MDSISRQLLRKEAREAKEGRLGKSSLLTRHFAVCFSNDNVAIKIPFRIRITFFKKKILFSTSHSFPLFSYLYKMAN